ncbi:MAG: hypothetical protein NC252_10140 [Roseburia sp.]|nr:hypothetical protein [Roseburia sp.]MCM1421386.1 hypothetical protein [Bacteroides sp.]
MTAAKRVYGLAAVLFLGGKLLDWTACFAAFHIVFCGAGKTRAIRKKGEQMLYFFVRSKILVTFAMSNLTIF